MAGPALTENEGVSGSASCVDIDTYDIDAGSAIDRRDRVHEKNETKTTSDPTFQDSVLPSTDQATSNAKSSYFETLDQVAYRARQHEFTQEEIVRARNAMHSYAVKFPARDNPDPLPPDDAIVVQFLAVAPRHRLEGLMYELAAERKECGFSYAWFFTVALQRLHGVPSCALRQWREEQRRIRGLVKDVVKNVGRMKR